MVVALHSALVRSCLECCVWAWAPCSKTGFDLMKQVKQRPPSELVYMSCGARLRELGLFSLEKRR